MVWKTIFLFNWVIFRFHLNLPGCYKCFMDYSSIPPFQTSTTLFCIFGDWLLQEVPGFSVSFQVPQPSTPMSLEKTRSQGHQVTNSQISMSPVWLRSWLQAQVHKEGKAKKKRRFRGKLANWCLVGLMFGFVGLTYKLCPILTRKRWNHSNWAPSNMSKKRYHYHVAILWVKCLPQIPLKLNKTPLQQNVIVLVVTITGRGVHPHIPTRWAPTS